LVLKHGDAHVSSTHFQLRPPGMWHNAVQCLEKHAASTFHSTLKMEATGSSRSFVHLYPTT